MTPTPKKPVRPKRAKKAAVGRITLAELLRALAIEVRANRDWCSLSMRVIEESFGVSKSLVSRIEHCKANPCLHTLDRLADAFGITTYDLIANAEARVKRARESGWPSPSIGAKREKSGVGK